jgi:ubiquinone biosynthesis protein UbiJ
MRTPDALLAPLQRALDALVAARTRTRAQAQALDGRTVAVELVEIGLTLHLAGRGERLVVSDGAAPDAATPDATLSGTLPAFLRALASEAAQLPHGLEVAGDATLVRDLRALLQGLEFDWEERLSRITGDAIAHRLGGLARDLGAWRRYAGERLARDVGEYLRDELRTVVARDEVEGFLDGVDRARDAAERLDRRLALVEEALAARRGAAR